jgi:hypothetical protein
MSNKTEELALSRMGVAGPDLLSLLQEALRLIAEDHVVRAIVADNQRAAQSLGPPADAVSVVGAGAVVTGTDGPAHTPGRGWRDTPSIEHWRPPGLEIMDRMVDQQDAIDKAALARRLAGR